MVFFVGNLSFCLIKVRLQRLEKKWFLLGKKLSWPQKDDFCISKNIVRFLYVQGSELCFQFFKFCISYANLVFYPQIVKSPTQELGDFCGKIGGKCEKLAKIATIIDELFYKYQYDLLVLLRGHSGKKKVGCRRKKTKNWLQISK